MWELEIIRERIRKKEAIQISTRFTKWGAVLSAFILIPAVLSLWMLVSSNLRDRSVTQMIAMLLLFLLSCLIVFQTIFAAEAVLEGKQLFINRILGPKYELDVSQIDKISYFRLSRTQYTIVKFHDNQGIARTALIMNSNSIIWGKEVPAAEILRMAQQM